MDTSRISFGEMIAGVGGLLLFLFMFIDWYGVDVDIAGFEASGGFNAWQAFSLIDILLFLAAAVAIAITVARALGALPALPMPAGQIVAIAGAVAVVLILFRLIVTPDAGGDEFDVTRKIGIFLGLISAGAIAFGGYTAMNEQAGGDGAAAAPPPAPPPPAP